MNVLAALSSSRPPPPTNPTDQVLLDTSDIAELLGCSSRTVVNLIRRGHLPASRLGPGRSHYRVHPAALLAFIEQYGHHEPDAVADSDPDALPTFTPTPALLLVARSSSGLCLLRPLEPPDPDGHGG